MTDWDATVDVLVAGSGGGGVTGAYTAAREGLEVLLVEATDKFGGTTAYSGGGGVWFPCNPVLQRAGTDDTIEDALELVVPHGNCVRLLYSKGGLTVGGVTADALLQATLRMRPDRVLLQELRDDAAWVYLNEVMTGHPGSLTTIHGADAPQAMRRLFNLVKGTPQGAAYGDDTLAVMIGSAVDAIVPLHNDAGTYSIREVWFADDAARRGEAAADLLRAA